MCLSNVTFKSHEKTWRANENVTFLKKKGTVRATAKEGNPTLIALHHLIKHCFCFTPNCSGNLSSEIFCCTESERRVMCFKNRKQHTGKVWAGLFMALTLNFIWYWYKRKTFQVFCNLNRAGPDPCHTLIITATTYIIFWEHLRAQFDLCHCCQLSKAHSDKSSTQS